MKTCIITGGNSGIGFEAACQLSEKGYEVTMICRNEQRAQEACTRIFEICGIRPAYIIADLSDLKTVRRAISEYMKDHSSLDVLINNAADFDLARTKPELNASGIEKQFATNVVAPYLLCRELIPIMNGGRIINISSQGLCVYPFIRLDFTNLNGERHYSPADTYYQNKLALLMFSLHMRARYPEVRIQAIRVTNVKIDMSRYDNISPLMKKMYAVKSCFSITPAAMAEVYTALSSEDDYEGFMYDEHLKEVQANRHAYDTEDQQHLVTLLDQLISQ